MGQGLHGAKDCSGPLLPHHFKGTGALVKFQAGMAQFPGIHGREGVSGAGFFVPDKAPYGDACAVE
jgi:hypothetical protein